MNFICVPKGHIQNNTAHEAHVILYGYEDWPDYIPVAPGATWEGELGFIDAAEYDMHDYRMDIQLFNGQSQLTEYQTVSLFWYKDYLYRALNLVGFVANDEHRLQHSLNGPLGTVPNNTEFPLTLTIETRVIDGQSHIWVIGDIENIDPILPSH